MFLNILRVFRPKIHKNFSADFHPLHTTLIALHELKYELPRCGFYQCTLHNVSYETLVPLHELNYAARTQTHLFCASHTTLIPLHELKYELPGRRFWSFALYIQRVWQLHELVYEMPGRRF